MALVPNGIELARRRQMSFAINRIPKIYTKNLFRLVCVRILGRRGRLRLGLGCRFRPAGRGPKNEPAYWTVCLKVGSQSRR